MRKGAGLYLEVGKHTRGIMWGRGVTSQNLELGHDPCGIIDESIVKMQRGKHLRERCVWQFTMPSLNIYSDFSPLVMAPQHLLHRDHCKESFVNECIDLNKVEDLVALQNCETSSNGKNDLREQLKKEGIRIRPFLNTTTIKGPENDRQFVSIVQVRDLRFVGAPAKSKKEAERSVCADAVRWLGDPANSREKDKKFWGSRKPRTETNR